MVCIIRRTPGGLGSLDLRDRDRLYALFEAILQYSRHFCIIRLANGESTSDVVRIEVSFEVEGGG